MRRCAAITWTLADEKRAGLFRGGCWWVTDMCRRSSSTHRRTFLFLSANSKSARTHLSIRNSCRTSVIYQASGWGHGGSTSPPARTLTHPQTDVSSQHRISFLATLAPSLCTDPPFDPYFKYLNIDSTGGSKCCAAPSRRPEKRRLVNCSANTMSFT